MRRGLQALALISIAAALALALGFGWTLWTAHQRGLEAKATNEAAAASIKSGAAAGHDAVQAVQSEAQSEAATTALTRRNTDAIEHARGAQVAVSPDAGNAGLAALCLRHAYRNDPACQQLRHPGS